MYVTELLTGRKLEVSIEPLAIGEYKLITKRQFFFDWKKERLHDVWKLKITETDEIVGLMSLIYFDREERTHINLLAVSRENRGRNKKYERIIGNLLGHACRISWGLYKQSPCVSLVPKDTIRTHYKMKYGMIDAGGQLYLHEFPLIELIRAYEP